MELKLTKIKGNLRGLTLFKGMQLSMGVISLLGFCVDRVSWVLAPMGVVCSGRDSGYHSVTLDGDKADLSVYIF